MSRRFRHFSLSLQSSMGAISAATAWIRDRATEHGLGDENLFKLELCTEELVTNIVTYSYRDRTGEIRLELLLDLDTAALTLIDAGPPFDPSTPAVPEIATSLQSARVGGLGIHLVQQFADEMRYERQDEHNRFTIAIGSNLPGPRHGERRSQQQANFPITRKDGTTVASEKRTGEDRRALGFVAQTAVFRNVPHEHVDHILARCEVRPFDAGEILLHAGTYHHCVLVVIEDHVEVHLEGPDSKFYFDLGPGECVGEIAVADGKPSSAWVRGGTSGRLLVIPEPVFLEDVLGDPDMARNVIIMMSERMRRITDQTVARLRAALELETLQRELDIARHIQVSMLPMSPLFEFHRDIEAQGLMHTARQVGGDFYDAFSIGEGRYFLAIGDVCGKGIPAALFMVRTLTLLRSEALRGERNADSLAEIATRVNNLLCENNGMQQFVTIFCGIVDVPAARLYYVNMGHNPPLLRLPAKPPLYIEHPRNPLAGLSQDLQYAAHSCEFPAGSLLLLYTDGVTEAEDCNGSQFGEKALLQVFSEAEHNTAVLCIERVVQAVEAFANGFVQSDDITLLAVESTETR